jgi:hypothetical protein
MVDLKQSVILSNVTTQAGAIDWIVGMNSHPNLPLR